jgi:hypothetical protein
MSRLLNLTMDDPPSTLRGDCSVVARRSGLIAKLPQDRCPMPSTERPIPIREPAPGAARTAPVAQPRWPVADVEALFALPFADLIYRAQQVHREHHAPNTVQLSTLLSIKTGGCSEDCGYCAQSKRHGAAVEEKPLLDIGTVVASARAARRVSAWVPRGADRSSAISSRCSKWCAR